MIVYLSFDVSVSDRVLRIFTALYSNKNFFMVNTFELFIWGSKSITILHFYRKIYNVNVTICY